MASLESGSEHDTSLQTVDAISKMKNVQDRNAKSTTKTENDETKSSELSSIVAAHYNHVKEVGLDERKNSRIYYMRNLNNWIKSVFIGEQLRVVRDEVQSRTQSFRKLKVLDLCCGKGGDLKKWFYGAVCHVIFVDIAETSVHQCQERYKVLSKRSNHFTAEFIVADCTKVRIRNKMKDVTCQLDLVSCQFAFHYCFESLPQVETMLKNAAECLRPGGRFIGTIPNAVEIIKRLRESNGVLKNEIFSIIPHFSKTYPLFGAKYDFKLEGVVDCPEFLVHFPTLVKLAQKFGLKYVHVSPLPRFFQEKIEGNLKLLSRMQGLETYPAEGGALLGSPGQYTHVNKKMLEGSTRVGTISAGEWDVFSLYLLFIFEKVDRKSWDAQGNPVYDLT